MTYKVGSMFAGIGGICLGFKRNNCEIVWANEIDKYACYTYRHNFNGAKYLIEGDIRDITHAKKINKKIKERRKLIKIKRIESEEDLLKRIDKEIPDIDILNGGFPCQAFSIAGERKGFEDERGNMFFEIEKVLKAKRPQAFLLENVKNLKTHDNGRTFKIIEQHLKNLGYTIKSEVLNSMTHGNVPQNRERIFIVGFLNEDIAENFSFPEAIELNRNIGDIINLNEKKNDKYYYNKTKYYKDLVVEMTRQDTLYQIRRGMYIRENRNNVCPTLTANMGTGGHNVPLVRDNYDIRKLTPEECLLFQGFNLEEYKFPDKFFDDKGKEKVYPDSQKYKQAGNCVTVTVVERIVSNMINAIETVN